MFNSRRAVAAACLTIAAGGAGTAVVAAPAGAATKAATGKGTVTASVTGPKGKTHQLKHAVSCTVHNGTYVLTERTKRSVATLRVPKYTGAGSYTGDVTVWRYGKKGLHRRHLQLPVTLTSTGGSATYAKTLSGKKDKALAGKKVSASASWTCTV